MRSFDEILNRTNWRLLREQKHALIRLQTRLRLEGKENSEDYSAIDGALEWMDFIQDIAAEHIGEYAIFGQEVASGNDVQAS